MNILIIGSGIILSYLLSHPSFDGFDIELYEIINNIPERSFHNNDNNGHGTAVCTLFLKTIREEQGVFENYYVKNI